MQVKVYSIDVHFPRWLKRAIVFGAIPAAVLLGAVHYLRADVTVPNTFLTDDILSATKMNENFSALQTGVNSLAATVTTLQGAVAGNAIPPGTVVAFAGTTVPSGWLLCDGSTVSRTTYTGLFAALGIAHGGGDGTTTFNLPDYRGRFLRGVDHGTGRDLDSLARSVPQPGQAGGPGNAADAVGSCQSDSMQGHLHGHQTVTSFTGTGGLVGTYMQARDVAIGLTQYNDNMITTPISDATNGLPRTSQENRPKNVNVEFIIKY